MTRRHEQLEEVIRRTLQESLRKGIADPRVRGIVSVGHVRLAPDMADALRLWSYPRESGFCLRPEECNLRLRQQWPRAQSATHPRLWFKKDAGAAAAAKVTGDLTQQRSP